MGHTGMSRNAATNRKRSGPYRTATRGVPERSESGDLRTCLVAFPRCDAAAGRPGGCEHFPCLGHSCMTSGRATNHRGDDTHPAAGGGSSLGEDAGQASPGPNARPARACTRTLPRSQPTAHDTETCIRACVKNILTLTPPSWRDGLSLRPGRAAGARPLRTW